MFADRSSAARTRSTHSAARRSVAGDGYRSAPLHVPALLPWEPSTQRQRIVGHIRSRNFRRALGIGIAYLFVGSPFGRDVLDKLIAMVGIKLQCVLRSWAFLSSDAKPPRRRCSTPSIAPYSRRPARLPAQQVLVQVFLHIPEQAARAQFMASVMDQAATLKGVQTLKVPARARQLRHGLAFRRRRSASTSRSRPSSGAVSRCSANSSSAFPRAHARRASIPWSASAVDGGLVGRIVVALSASPDSAAPQSVPQGTSARRYNHAFLSYASPDRKEVLKRAQILQAAGVELLSGHAQARSGDEMGEGRSIATSTDAICFSCSGRRLLSTHSG